MPASTTAATVIPATNPTAMRGEPDCTYAAPKRPASRTSTTAVRASQPEAKGSASRRITRSGGTRRTADSGATLNRSATPVPRASPRSTAAGCQASIVTAGRNPGEEARREREHRGGDRDTGHASGEPEQRGLGGVEEHDLARPHAEALQDGDRVEARCEPGANRLGDADAAEDQGDQRDEAEESRDPLQTLAKRGLRVGVGLDAHAGRLGECRAETLAGGLRVAGAGRRRRA